MSVDKTIVNEDKTAYIGGFVEYKVETQIPKYGTEYTNPVFNIYDKMSNGLSFVNDAAHKLKVLQAVQKQLKERIHILQQQMD